MPASNMSMKLKKIQREEVGCTTSAARPFGCMEIWAGYERAHRSLELAGLEAEVIAAPSGGKRGGDLSAVFSYSDNIARVVLADCVGRGYVTSRVARQRLRAALSPRVCRTLEIVFRKLAPVWMPMMLYRPSPKTSGARNAQSGGTSQHQGEVRTIPAAEHRR